MLNPHPTPFSDLNTVLKDLSDGITQILRDDLLSLCLQGSFAMGDFDRESDVDFIAVTKTELTDAQVDALKEMHRRIHAGPSKWSKHLEGSYFPQSTLRDRTLAGKELWYIDNGSDQLVRSKHCNTLVVRWTLFEHGIVLEGVDPRALLEPVPADELKAEVKTVLTTWGQEMLDQPGTVANLWYQSFVVVSLCRILHTLATGRVFSKRAGVEWALEHLPPTYHGLINRAWANRPDPSGKCRIPVDPDELQQTLEFLRYAIERHGHFQ